MTNSDRNGLGILWGVGGAGAVMAYVGEQVLDSNTVLWIGMGIIGLAAILALAAVIFTKD